MMKVKLKSILKTTDHLFEPFQQNQYIFQAGNTLTIKQFHKSSSTFIPLTKQLTHLYSFKPAPNKKACFVAQKINHDKIYISQYTLKKQRKSICLSESHQLFPSNIISHIQLLVDEFDSFLVYGYVTSSNNDNCLFLIDFNKMKIIAMGYVGQFNDIKVNTNENLMLSLCSNNTVRSVHVYNGFWETEQKVYKKIGNVNIIKHELLSSGILLLCTKSTIYFLEQMQIIQMIQVFDNHHKDDDDEIRDVIKTHKTIIILTKKQQMKIFIEDHNEMTYVYKSNLEIKLKDKQKISKIVVTGNGEEFLLRTNDNQLYVWKTEELDSPTQIVHEFQKVQNATITQPKGVISLASGKQTALLASDNGVTLWDLERNVSFLQFQFMKFQKNSEKAIYAAAINPDGNSMICAFEDKIKIFKILLTKLRFIAQFNIKRCNQLVFSHGGQYVACKYAKGINSSIIILNTLRMTQITTFKTHGEPSHILWNEMDDELIVATENNQITMFKLSQISKAHSIKIPQKINMIRTDYQTKRILVSTDKEIYVLNDESIERTIQPNILHFNFIYPLHGIYFAASKNGTIYWSNTINFQNYNELSVFINSSFSLIYRNGYMLAYNSFENITVIECLRNSLPAKKQLLKNSQDVVFVQKDEINLFFQKIKNLQASLQQLQTVTTVKLEEQRRKYDDSMQKNIQKFNQEITYLQKKYQQMNIEKIRQQKQNGRVFDDLESGQIQSVNELQRMYDRKIKLQRQKYMQLQQKNIQQKIHYQKLIFQLEKRYHDDIVKIRQEYSTKLKDQFKRLQENRQQQLQYKKKMEYKLIELQQQSDITMFQLQKTKDDKIQELTENILKLENLYDNSKVELHNQLGNFRSIEEKCKNMQNQLKKTQQTLTQANQRVKLLQSEIEKDKKIIQEKNTIISQNEHQIGGLEKAKYVLSFRTTEIRKQLQPKENLIDKLKSEMFKLDEQFKEQKKRSYGLGQRVDKLDKLNKIMKQENTEFKLKLKNRQRSHDQMCVQIFTIVNELDQKQWPAALVKVYQNHIKQDDFKNRKKKSKDATAEQINRHLIHLQQSLMQVNGGNQKILKGKDIDVMRKMKQNAELVYDLNVMRKKETEYLKEIKQKTSEIARLNRELMESNRSTTRAHTAKSGTRRMFSRQKIAPDLGGFDLSFKRDNQVIFDKRQLKTRQSRSRVSSGYKTMILRSSDKKQNTRFFDLAKQLQSAKSLIQKQQKIIEQMNHRLLQQSMEE